MESFPSFGIIIPEILLRGVVREVKTTMKDVAALAGVGVGTVSRVINGVKVKEVTKEK